MNKEFKYMPLETDATGGRGGDIPAISKHMSKSPLGLYKSPAQMAESPVKMDGKSVPKEKYGKSNKSLKPNKSESVISTAGEKLKNAKQKIQKFTNSLPKWLNSY